MPRQGLCDGWQKDMSALRSLQHRTLMVQVLSPRDPDTGFMKLSARTDPKTDQVRRDSRGRAYRIIDVRWHGVWSMKSVNMYAAVFLFLIAVAGSLFKINNPSISQQLHVVPHLAVISLPVSPRPLVRPFVPSVLQGGAAYLGRCLRELSSLVPSQPAAGDSVTGRVLTSDPAGVTLRLPDGRVGVIPGGEERPAGDSVSATVLQVTPAGHLSLVTGQSVLPTQGQVSSEDHMPTHVSAGGQ